MRGAPRPLAVAAVVLMLITGCNPEKAPETEDPVCGMVDRDLVLQVVPSGQLDTLGDGMRTREQRKAESSNCNIRDAERTQTVMQLSIGEPPDPAEWKRTLASEAADNDYGKTVATYTGDPGIGYGKVYDSGIWVNGATVRVMKGDVFIHVTVYEWTDATPQERLALAEDVARNLHVNLRKFDAGNPN